MSGAVGDQVAPSDNNAVAASAHYVRSGEARMEPRRQPLNVIGQRRSVRHARAVHHRVVGLVAEPVPPPVDRDHAVIDRERLPAMHGLIHLPSAFAV